ncbi:nucleoside-diphosphate-sugar epimerase [Candidatus Magnetoovum chiemensis]|nr:nucleoside-diphosphate-sugar epimerase [Candidatus Magnetoovum chiemensis]
MTGAAGFIGYHLSKHLAESDNEVIGIDNLNNYYDVKLKLERLQILEKNKRFKFIKADICNREKVFSIFSSENFDCAVNLAAQAGVRYSISNPYSYIESNIYGFLNILEGSRNNGIKHLVFASSSSVYGANTRTPFSIHHNVDHPISLYGATKRSNELMAHSYAHLYGIPCTGLRLFTVYGPWGRPDMAIFSFTKAILDGKPIDLFNYGKMQRDFTYIDDVIEAIVRIIPNAPIRDGGFDRQCPDPSSSYAAYKIYNIGNNQMVNLMRLVELIEDYTGRKAIKNMMPIQDGDVEATWADIDDTERDIHFKPSTSIEQGLKRFIEWFIRYHGRQ